MPGLDEIVAKKEQSWNKSKRNSGQVVLSIYITLFGLGLLTSGMFSWAGDTASLQYFISYLIGALPVIKAVVIPLLLFLSVVCFLKKGVKEPSVDELLSECRAANQSSVFDARRVNKIAKGFALKRDVQFVVLAPAYLAGWLSPDVECCALHYDNYQVLLDKVANTRLISVEIRQRRFIAAVLHKKVCRHDEYVFVVHEQRNNFDKKVIHLF